MHKGDFITKSDLFQVTNPDYGRIQLKVLSGDHLVQSDVNKLNKYKTYTYNT